MRTITIALAVYLISIPAAFSASSSSYVSAAGSWRWSAKESVYISPYARDQTMTIKRDDPTAFALHQETALSNGTTVKWDFDGHYDGQAAGGGWSTWKLKRLSDTTLLNDYTMADGKRGHEVWLITPDRITIGGSFVDSNDKPNPYIEVWLRVRK